MTNRYGSYYLIDSVVIMSTTTLSQSLQWETRQCRTLKAASLEHMVKYILLLTPSQQMDTSLTSSDDFDDWNDDTNSERSAEMSSTLLEERNNAAHAMHVIFATYREYAMPAELFDTMLRLRTITNAKQFNFVLYYWLNNFPEDFWTAYGTAEELKKQKEQEEVNSASHSSNASEDNLFGSTITLADQLISMRNIDEEVKKHCLHLLDMRRENSFATCRSMGNNTETLVANKKSSIVEHQPKFIAQQLTTIDMVRVLW